MSLWSIFDHNKSYLFAAVTFVLCIVGLLFVVHLYIDTLRAIPICNFLQSVEEKV